MPTTMTSRAFNQDTGAAKRAAKKEPVFITHRGEPSFVLMSAAEYRRLTEKEPSIVDLIAMPGEYVEFEPEKLGGPLRGPSFRDEDLS